MEKIGEQVGARIAQVRSSLPGMTQAALARQMTKELEHEVKPLIVTRIEGGKRPLTVDELVVIARILTVEVSDLLAPTDDELPDVKLRQADLAHELATTKLIQANEAFEQARARWHSTHAVLRNALDESHLDNANKDLYGYNDSIISVIRPWEDD